jgi:putative transposase
MGRVGAVGDKAVTESFCSLLKKVVSRKVRGTRLEKWLAIVPWIKATYYRKRRRRGLGKFTPIEFEAIKKTPVTLAA